MKYLLDTCSLIWFIGEITKIRPATQVELEADTSELIASYVSLIEIAAKVSTGRLQFSQPLEPFFNRILPELDISLLPLEEGVIFETSRLPPIHKDPFDRLLVAQALALDLTIVTPDSKFAPYGVKVLW